MRLRNYETYNQKKIIQTIAVTSGKGGVGKTSIVANLAVSLSEIGKKVLIFDANLGLSNIDVFFNLKPEYTIEHVLKGEKSLSEVIVQGADGIWILPASSGIEELERLNEFQRLRLIDEFEQIRIDIDFLLIDTGAGVSSNVSFFCVAAQRILIVVSPEPTSLTDAHALIRILSTKYHEKEFYILVNRVKSSSEARLVFEKLSTATEKVSDIILDYFGYIPADENVLNSVQLQKSVVHAFPESPAARSFMDIARKLNENISLKIKGGLQFFLGKLLEVNGNETF